MQRITLSFILLSLFACRQKPAAFRYHFREDYCLVDSASPAPLTPFGFDGEAHYPICYVGPPKEHIPMHRRLQLHGPRHYATHPLKWETDSSALTITVDSFTTQFEQHHQRRDTAFPFSFIDSVSYHPANTVILRNRSDSTLVVGDRDFLQYIALEVKKENGEWVCLEKSAQDAYDPVGWVSFIYLNPGEILVAKFPRYAPGEVRQCRLAWRMKNGPPVYSQPFTATVSYLMLRVMDLMQ